MLHGFEVLIGVVAKGAIITRTTLNRGIHTGLNFRVIVYEDIVTYTQLAQGLFRKTCRKAVFPT